MTSVTSTGGWGIRLSCPNSNLFEVMKSSQLQLLSKACFILGFASIIGSIVIWYTTGGTIPESQAHAERFGIFVGLWAPTFFILSNRFDRYATKLA
jgi:hypothetical protein